MKTGIYILILVLCRFCAFAQFENPSMVGSMTLPVLGTGSPYVPTNTYAYYDASSIVISDGALVPTWTDSSGNGKTISVYANNSATYSPYFSNSVSTINNKPAVIWTGSQLMTNSFGSTLAPPWTVIMVAQAESGAFGAYYFDGYSASPRMVFAQSTTSTFQGEIYNGTAFALGSGPLVSLKWYVFTLYFNGSSSYIRTNGVNYLAPGTDIGSAGSKGLAFGARYDFTANKLISKIAYIILRNGTMNTNDLQWDENSLKTTFGL